MRRRLISGLIVAAAVLLFVYAVARYVIGQSNLRAAKRYQTEHPGRFVDLGRPRVLGTKDGQSMRRALEARPAYKQPGVKPLEVVIVGKGGSYTYRGSQSIALDINDVGAAYPSLRPGGVYSYERIIGHELGHAAMGVQDVGVGRMYNITQYENPIMRQLGDTNDRIAY